jgi:hypothetical protein
MDNHRYFGFPHETPVVRSKVLFLILINLLQFFLITGKSLKDENEYY